MEGNGIPDRQQRLPQRFAGALAIAGTVAASLLLTARAGAMPEVPAGYVVAAEHGAWVFRPAGDPDPELVIRVFGPFASTQSLPDFLLHWARDLPGTDSFPTPTDRPELSVTTRVTQVGDHKTMEAISAIRSQQRKVFVEQLSMRMDRAAMRNSLTDANGKIAGAIYRDEMPSPPPAVDASPLRVGTAHSAALQNINAIDSIGFDSVTHMGYGGMLTFDPTPMLLLKSGDAADMTVLNAPEGLAAHRAANPKAWMHWRRNARTIEVDRTGHWTKLPYTKTLGPAPPGYRLSGAYQRLTGSGNIALGGTASVVAWSNLQFDRSGAFTTGGGSGSFTGASNGAAQVATSGVRADEHGNYAVSGFTLTLRYASGRVEQRAIVIDPQEPDVVWIDGEGWTRP